MRSCCDICIDPNCGGKQDCNCDTCLKKDSCYRLAGLKPTIRITRKCTQSCSHCCFECSSNEMEMMSIETSSKINQFCKANDIRRCQIMGGEFFMNPDWEIIMDNLVNGLISVRIVSNGDWASDSDIANKVIKFMVSHPQCYMGISNDKWHTNTHVIKALEYLNVNSIKTTTPTIDEIGEDTIVPIGRSEFDMSIYGMMACYCRKPDRRYSFLIDEFGKIYKCAFGSWKYANVDEYINGGFSKRFKEFNNKFYNAWISSCAHCRRAESHSKQYE